MTDRTIDWVFRATDKTGAAFRSVDAKLSGITKSLRTFAGFSGFAAVATGLVSLTKSLVDMGSELQDASEKLGVSAEGLQVLKFAAEQTGTSFDALQTALAFNTKLVGNASRGNKEAAESLKLLGISAAGFVNVPIDRRLSIIADRLQKVSDPAQRLDLAIKVLGRSAGDLVPLLSQGSAGLAKFEEKLRSTNSILSNEQVKALDDAGDAWSAFVLRLKVSAAPALVTTLGLVNDVVAAFEKAKKLNPDGRLNAATALGVAVGQQLGAPGAEPPKGPGNRSGRRYPERNSEIGQAEAAFGAAAFRSSSEGQSVPSRLKVMFDEVNAAAEKSAKAAAAAQAEAADKAAEYAAEVQDLIGGISKLSDEANRVVIDRGAELTAKYKPAIDVLTEGVKEINGLWLANAISTDVANAAIQDYGDAYQRAMASVNEATDEVKTSTQEMFEQLKLAADGFARDLTDVFFDSTNSIGDMFKGLANTIAKALFTKGVTEPLINSILGSVGGSLFGGARAMGGPVTSGTPYLVGERGPELFVPGASGKILPGGDQPAQVVNVNFTISSVDPQTAAQTIAAQERLITSMVRRATQRAGVRPQLV